VCGGAQPAACGAQEQGLSVEFADAFQILQVLVVLVDDHRCVSQQQPRRPVCLCSLGGEQVTVADGAGEVDRAAPLAGAELEHGAPADLADSVPAERDVRSGRCQAGERSFGRSGEQVVAR
jgi:hypothetical protein